MLFSFERVCIVAGVAFKGALPFRSDSSRCTFVGGIDPAKFRFVEEDVEAPGGFAVD